MDQRLACRRAGRQGRARADQSGQSAGMVAIPVGRGPAGDEHGQLGAAEHGAHRMLVHGLHEVGTMPQRNPIYASKAVGLTLAAVLALLSSGCTLTATNKAPDKLAAGWISLFDGRTLDGWTVKIVGHPAAEDPLQTFPARDGVLNDPYD